MSVIMLGGNTVVDMAEVVAIELFNDDTFNIWFRNSVAPIEQSFDPDEDKDANAEAMLKRLHDEMIKARKRGG